MSKHVDLLGLLYVVAGALSALVAVSLLSLGLGELTIAWGPVGERSSMAATLTGATFILVAVVLLVCIGLQANARPAREGRAVSLHYRRLDGSAPDL